MNIGGWNEEASGVVNWVDPQVAEVTQLSPSRKLLVNIRLDDTGSVTAALQTPLSLQKAFIPAGTEWQANWPGWGCFRVDRGSAYWMESRRQVDIGPGEVVVGITTPTAVVRASQIDDVLAYYFWFEPDSLWSLVSPNERQSLQEMWNKGYGTWQKFDTDQRISKRFAEICQPEYAANGFHGRSVMLGLAAEFLAPGMGRPDSEDRFPYLPGPRFQKLMRLLPESGLLEQSAEKLAAKCGCSVRHFHRLFFQAYGISLSDRIRELRLQTARQMLEETGCDVAEIALKNGFTSRDMFLRQFKRKFGVSPSEFRRGVTCADQNFQVRST